MACQSCSKNTSLCNVGWTDFDMQIESAGDDPKKADNVQESARYMIRDKTMYLTYFYCHFDNTGASSGDAGFYRFRLPGNYRARFAGQCVGSGYSFSSTATGTVLSGVNSVSLYLNNANSVQPVGVGMFDDLSNSQVKFTFNAIIELQ